jgi:hypothetical protein
MPNTKIANDTIIEIITAPAGRKPPQIRNAPHVGHNPGMALGWFWLCVCGSEVFSATPITSCPSCHRRS